MMLKISFFLFLLVAANSTTQASELSYSFVEIGYGESSADFGFFTFDGDGFNLAGSYEVSDAFAITGEFSKRSFDFDIDIKETTFGVDFHTPLAESIDLVVGVSLLDVEILIPFFPTDNDTGNVISTGIRYKLSNNIELSADLFRRDVFDDTASGFNGGILIDLSDNVALGFVITSSEGSESFTFGVRIQ